MSGWRKKESLWRSGSKREKDRRRGKGRSDWMENADLDCDSDKRYSGCKNVRSKYEGNSEKKCQIVVIIITGGIKIDRQN